MTQCDAAIEQLEATQFENNFQISSNERRSARAIEIGSRVNSELAAAVQTVSTYNTIIDGLPVGDPVRTNMEEELITLNYRVHVLEKRAERFGTAALMEYSIQNDSLQEKATGLAAAIAAINAHKDTL